MKDKFGLWRRIANAPRDLEPHIRHPKSLRMTPSLAAARYWAKLLWQVSRDGGGVLELKRAKALFLVLSGPVGCGKTTAAASMLFRGPPIHAPDHCARHGLTGPDAWNLDLFPRRISAMELAYVAGFDERDWWMLTWSPLLVVDDLGDEKVEFHESGRRIVEMRNESGLPTIITTNLTQELFKERYGERILSRVLGHGRWHTATSPVDWDRCGVAEHIGMNGTFADAIRKAHAGANKRDADEKVAQLFDLRGRLFPIDVELAQNDDQPTESYIDAETIDAVLGDVPWSTRDPGR